MLRLWSLTGSIPMIGNTTKSKHNNRRKKREGQNDGDGSMWCFRVFVADPFPPSY